MNPSNTRHQEILSVELTDEERDYAIWQAKYVKWSRERNKDYWQSLEKKKAKEDSQNVVSKQHIL